jgi:hypothetical protein
MLAACATTGLYQARDGENGYAETRQSEAQWRVEFVGDDFASRETVETYLLYRAAELTAESGYAWFAMSEPAVSEDAEIVVEAERRDAYRARYWQPNWRRRDRFFWSDVDSVGPMPHERRTADGPRVRTNVHYSASAEIVMGNGDPPEGAFVARETIVGLEGAIRRPNT